MCVTFAGNCNAFDDGANGYCRADAVGSVILKRLEDAEADNDPIFGVIVGSTTNHCGQTDSITRPHEGDQSSVFRRVMRYANYDPLDVGYIEMHVSIILNISTSFIRFAFLKLLLYVYVCPIQNINTPSPA